MREIRQSGSEGGARFNPSFLPLSIDGRSATSRPPETFILRWRSEAQRRQFINPAILIEPRRSIATNGACELVFMADRLTRCIWGISSSRRRRSKR
jgi:hypothetical protein